MLIDTDKFSDDRSSPLPLSHDVLAMGTVGAKGTNSVNYVTQATNQSLIQAGRNGQFTIVQRGSIPAGFVSLSGGVSIFAGGTFTIATVPHNLTYTPGVVAYLFDNNSYKPLPRVIYLGGTGPQEGVDTPGPEATWVTYRITVDATNIYILLDVSTFNISAGAVTTGPIVYYLLQQTSN